MTTTAVSPLANARFEVSVEGLNPTHAIAVVFPAARATPTRGQRRTATFTDLVLRRALTADTQWNDWWNSLGAARPAARTVVVTLNDAAGVAVAHWTFAAATPLGYSVSPLDAMGQELVVETLELSVSGFEMRPGAPPPISVSARRRKANSVATSRARNARYRS